MQPTPVKRDGLEKAVAPNVVKTTFGVPLVAQMSMDLFANRSKTRDSNTLSPEHITAIKDVREALSEDSTSSCQSLSLKTIAKLCDASAIAYGNCTHPARSDLLAMHAKALAICISHSSEKGDIQFVNRLLGSIGLAAPYPVDPVQSIMVLVYDLMANEGFALIEQARKISTTLRDVLAFIDIKNEFEVIEQLAPTLGAITAVAISSLFPCGVGFLGPGVGPAKTKNTVIHELDKTSLSIAFSPNFQVSIRLAPQLQAISLNRDQFRTLLALLIGDQASRRASYRLVSVSPPSKDKPVVLKTNNISVPMSFHRYMVLQRLCAIVDADADCKRWIDFRASMFGDI
jgi:hypothetical protein